MSAAGTVLSVRHLCKSYRAGQPVLTDINLEVMIRSITAVIGPSGTGKSTLIRCINRLVEPTSGSIMFEGTDLIRLRRRELREARRRVGIARAVMQQPSLLLADEPTSSLDPKTSVEIMQLLTDIARDRGIPVIINMHDVGLARRFADRIIGMAGGCVVFDAVPGLLAD